MLVVTGQILTGRYIKLFSEHIRDNTTYLKLNYFWSFMIVVLFINLFEMFFQMSFTWYFFVADHRLVPIKLILLGLAILSMVIGIGFGCLQRLFPLYLLHFIKGDLIQSASKSKPLRCFHSLVMCNLFLFVSFICTGFITTVLIMLVHPILTLSLIAYITTSIFCFISFVSMSTSCGLSLLLVKDGKLKEYKAICSQACNSLLYIMMFISINRLCTKFTRVIDL